MVRSIVNTETKVIMAMVTAAAMTTQTVMHVQPKRQANQVKITEKISKMIRTKEK